MTIDHGTPPPEVGGTPEPAGPELAGPEPAGPEPAGTAQDRAEERRDLAGIEGTTAGRAFRLAILAGLILLLGVTRGLSIVIVILAIVFCVFLHELGHFLAAKWSGMKATEFFIGFGPKIWSFQRGETEYGLKAIPAGAYVRILGMSNLEEVDPADEPRAYRQKPFRSRLGVAVAGSCMHFAIAIVLLFVQFAFIGAPDGDRWEIGAVTPGSAAAAAGLRSGDRIQSINGEPVSDYTKFRKELAAANPGDATLVVERDGSTSTVTADLSTRMKVVGTIGEDLDLLDGGDGVHVGALAPGGQAESSGLTEGAKVTSINGQSVNSLDDVATAVDRSIGGTVQIATAAAAGENHAVDLGSALDTTGSGAFLGVGSQAQLATEPLPVAAGRSISEFGHLVGASVAGVGQFIWPPNIVDFVTSVGSSEPADSVSSPTPAASSGPSADASRPVSIVGAVLYGSDLTSENVANLVLFLITLNVFIGVFNLIPLLPFDGGHVAIAVYEKAQEMRRRSTKRYMADVSRMLPVAYTVVMVLVVIGVLAMYLDLTRGVPT